MLERYYVTPENTYKVGGNRKVIYTPVIVVKSEDDDGIRAEAERLRARSSRCRRTSLHASIMKL